MTSACDFSKRGIQLKPKQPLFSLLKHYFSPKIGNEPEQGQEYPNRRAQWHAYLLQSSFSTRLDYNLAPPSIWKANERLEAPPDNDSHQEKKWN